jgi:hypothetical protein
MIKKEANKEDFSLINQTIVDLVTNYFLSEEWKGVGLGRVQKDLNQLISNEIKEEFILNISKPPGSIILAEVTIENNPILRIQLDKSAL